MPATPRSVMVLKKIGDELLEEFVAVLDYLGCEQARPCLMISAVVVLVCVVVWYVCKYGWGWRWE